MTHQVAYSSRASEPMTAASLEKILVDARAGNQARVDALRFRHMKAAVVERCGAAENQRQFPQGHLSRDSIRQDDDLGWNLV